MKFVRALPDSPGLPVACLLAALLAGCATRPALDAGARAEAWKAHRAQIAQMRDWDLSGRIAVQLEHDAFSGALYWTQQGETFALRLVAPLGRGSYELSGDRNGVMLRTADNQILHAQSPEVLMQTNLGWQLPVSGLRYWIRGLPEPDVGTEGLTLDGAGRLETLSQRGWTVEYQRYTSAGVATLPGRIELRNGTLKVRMIISHWDVPS